VIIQSAAVLEAVKMLWGGSGEHISIAALTNAMEPRHDETQNQDCELKSA
jgi:hypothetical protein